MSDTLRAEVRRFVMPRFPGFELTDDQDLFALGFVNSLFAMELVLFIEQLIGTRVPNDELSLDNFNTVDGIVRLAERLTASAVTAGSAAA